MRLRRLVAALCLAVAGMNGAAADEVVRTIDGRSFLLLSDGTYSIVEGLGTLALAGAIPVATAYGRDKATMLTCLAGDPDGLKQSTNYYSEDEAKTRSIWLGAGGSAAEWSQIEAAFAQPDNAPVTDCAAVLDGFARMERFSWPLSMRSPFKEMSE